MAMTETPAQQQQYLQETVSAAGSSSTASPSLDEVKKAPFQKLEAPVASSSASNPGNNAPTPPSSPPQAVPIEPLDFSRSNPPDQAETSTSSAVSTTSIQQQPTPPSTLPEDTAAFPQAVTDQSESSEDETAGSLAKPTSTETNASETYLVESHSPELPSMQQNRPRSVSPVSANSSSSSSFLNDGVPTLDANEAAFVLDNDHAEGNEPEPAYRRTTSRTPVPPSRLDERLPRIPSHSEIDEPSLTINRRPSQPELPALPQDSLFQQESVTDFLFSSDSQQHPSRYSSLPISQGSGSTGVRSHRHGASALRTERRRPRSPDFTVPPWQPDSEVSSCPICATSFSFFYRKHHCRKCGRVVCAPCSPHRIVIPKSFVVSPPNALDADLATLGYTETPTNRSSYIDSDAGVEVRICNNCLAGESSAQEMDNERNPVRSPAGGAGRFWQEASPSSGGNGSGFPHQRGISYGGNPSSNRRRTVSNVHPFTQAHGGQLHQYGGGPYYGQPASMGDRPSQGFGHFPQHPPYHVHPYQQSQNSGAPMLQHPTPSHHQHFHPSNQDFSLAPAQFYPSPQPLQYHHQQYPHHGHQRSVSSSSPHTHTYSQYSPVNQPIRGHLDTSGNPIPAFSMPDSRPRLPIASQFMQGSSRELQTHSAPPQPRLRETDYCPICQSVLPPPDPITKDETAREAHIQQCIENQMSSNDGNRRRSTAGTPTGNASSPPVVSRVSQSPAIGTSSHPERPRRNTGANRMVFYTAAEKDTFALGNDAEAEGRKAECVICFEEFEAGDTIARLECFCRYHKKCIQDWFGRKDNATCPIHAMNE